MINIYYINKFIYIKINLKYKNKLIWKINRNLKRVSVDSIKQYLKFSIESFLKKIGPNLMNK